MPRSPKDNREIRDARREAIVAAATRVFAAKGFADATITQIAAEAGLSHGLVYHYFSSKEAVFAAIADVAIGRVAADLDVDAERAIERITLSIERARERICAPADAHLVMMQAFVQGSMPEEIKQRLFDRFRANYETVVEWVAEAQEQGDADATVPAAELAGALVCLMRGMSIKAKGMPALPFALPQAATILRLLRPGPTRSKRARPLPREPRHAEKKAVPGKKARGTHVKRSHRS
jgi:AcrR family transcriptional regulator